TIPRAIGIALVIAIGIYLAVAFALLRVGDPASTTAPLAAAVDGVGAVWAVPVVRIGAALASLGALLALIAGVAAPRSPWPAIATCRPGCPPYIPAIRSRTTPSSR